MSVVFRISVSAVTGSIFHFFLPAVSLVTGHISNDTLPKAKCTSAFDIKSTKSYSLVSDCVWNEGYRFASLSV